MSQEKTHFPSITLRIIFFIVIALISIIILMRQSNIQPYLPYHLEWNKMNANGSIEIAGFSEGENWIGDYTLDSMRSLDGNTGLNLFSKNGTAQKIQLKKEVDLSSFDSVFVTLYIENERFAQQTESLTFYLITKDGFRFSSPILKMQRGWNLVALPLASFTDEKHENLQKNKKISTLGFTLISFKDQLSQITFDRLWAEKYNRSYLSPISSLNPISTSLKTIDKHTFLNLFSTGINRLSFHQVEQLTHFNAITKVVPESKGSFGFFITAKNTPLSEISFLINHENMWQLDSIEKGKKQNRIASGRVQELYNISTPFWLRIIKQGNSLSIDYSLDANTYRNIIKTNKIRIDSGEFGLLSNGSFLLDFIDIKP